MAGSTDLSQFVLNIGNIEIRYGAFLTSVINFLIMAFVLFMLLKMFNKIKSIGKKMLLKIRFPLQQKNVRTASVKYL